MMKLFKLFLFSSIFLTPLFAHSLDVSIYDVAHDFKKVRIHLICEDGRRLDVIVPRKALDDLQLGDVLGEFLIKNNCK